MDRLVYRDRAGNTLWSKDAGNRTMYGKNADGVLLRRKDFGEMLAVARRSGRVKGVYLRQFLSVKP